MLPLIPFARSRRLAQLAAACALLSTLSSASAAPRYTGIDLGTLGGSSSAPTGLNEQGDVVGNSLIAGDAAYHGFFFDGSRLQDLGESVQPAAVNDRDEVAGQFFVDGVSRGFVYRAGTFNDVGSLAGPAGSSFLTAINAAGHAAGHSQTAAGPQTCVVYDGSALVDIGSLGTGCRSRAINESGVVTGDNRIPGVGFHAFVAHRGSMRDIGTLGGSSSSGRGINAAGTIVGTSTTAAGYARAFVYRGGALIELGVLPGGETSQTGAVARDINPREQIVGSSGVANDDVHAFFFDGTMVDLNDLWIDAPPGLTLRDAVAINRRGQIAVGALDDQGRYHAILLTPVAGFR